jgi:dipicolinate synthase subunit A
MKDSIKLAILGGDDRQIYLSSMLADKGFECSVWGISAISGNMGGATKTDVWSDAVHKASAVILPLPASIDGVTVNCSSLYDGDVPKLRLNTVLDIVDVPVFGGRFTDQFIEIARAKNKRVIDYFASETLQIRNATPTAEGAISVAMSKLKITICGCRATVVGYGRIGQRLAHLLFQMGAQVTVAARSHSALALAASFGYSTIRLENNEYMRGLESLGNEVECDVIFNTVPTRLFDRSVLSRLPKNILLIDLASVPGGVDFHAAKEEGIEVVWALSLPGKYAPESAGRIIGESLIEYFESEGII